MTHKVKLSYDGESSKKINAVLWRELEKDRNDQRKRKTPWRAVQRNSKTTIL